MTIKEHLLTILAEECAEVAQRASKALRFGLDETQPEQASNNAERIMEEFDDLCAVVEMLQARSLLPGAVARRREEKREKIQNFLCYSKRQGTLQ